MSCQIKAATLKEAPLVTDFTIRLISELDGSGPVGVPDAESLTAICRQLIQNEDHRIFIAADNDKAAAMITVGRSIALYAGGEFGVIHEFYVLPEYRSQGIGRALLDAVIAFGRRMGWTRLEVGAPNRERWERTVSFYRREGFVETGPRLKRIYID